MFKDRYDLEFDRLNNVPDDQWTNYIVSVWTNHPDEKCPIFAYLPSIHGRQFYEELTKPSCCPTIVKRHLADGTQQLISHIPEAIINAIAQEDIPTTPTLIKPEHIPAFMRIQRLADKFRKKPLGTKML